MNSVAPPFTPTCRSGFALIITLIMVTLAAVMAVGLLTSASSERITAKSNSDRFRAEMAAQSGLSAALNALSGIDPSTDISVPNDFQFVTAVGHSGTTLDDSKPELIPLKYNAPDGVVSLDTALKRPLYSSSLTAAATLTLSTATPTKESRQVGFIPIMTKDKTGAAQETQRYAFYIDEGGSRQNLGVQGGAPRAYAREPKELPLITTSVGTAAVPFTAAQLNLLEPNRGLLLTPLTANPALAGDPVTPPIDYYSYATASAITNLTPEGKPRVNLLKLKEYVDPLTVDQTSGNARAALVDRLLNPSEDGKDWGDDDGSGGKRPGGNLAFLTKLSRYNATQQKQIVANLLDYIDADLIPTTDNVDSPTYFGTEGRYFKDDAGTWQTQGHPYINFVGTGLVFNRSSAAASMGGLNSTRVLLVLGIVNPWTSPTKEWNQFYALQGVDKPLEIDIEVLGTASGGNLGPNAKDYFVGVFTTRPENTLNQLTSYPPEIAPKGTIPPNKGYAFPTRAGSSTNYATNFDILGKHGRQPPGMVFKDLGFKINKLRLKYTGTDGKNGFVQVLDNLKVVSQPADPSLVNLDHQGGSLVYKFASGAPDKKDFHLNADPRLGYIPANWLLSKSSESGSNPPNPTSTIAIFNGSDSNHWDFTAAPPETTNHLWYTKTDITQNLFVKSPPQKDNGTFPPPTFDASGELGYLHTGLPWETLRFYVTDAEASAPTPKTRDREFLAYVQSGTFPKDNYGIAPTRVGATAPVDPIPLLGGPLNINTNKRPTLLSLFLGASALTDGEAASRAQSGNDPEIADPDGFVENYALTIKNTPNALPGDFLSSEPARKITNATTNDFDREMLARRAANVIGTQSTRFAVYSVGEARDRAGGAVITTSRVNLRAEVELQTDSLGRPVPKVLNMAYYVTN